jgi:protease I
MPKSILMPVGDFVEDYEVMVPFQALLSLDLLVHAVCPGKAAGETVKTAVHDFEGDQTYTEKPGHRFQVNATFADVKAEQYDGLYIPGGRAPEYIRLDTRLQAMVRHFFETSKPVSSVCHGVQILAASGVVSGRTISCYPACQVEVTRGGGRYADIAVDAVQVDGNLVSGPAWPAHPAVLREFYKLLGVTIAPYAVGV